MKNRRDKSLTSYISNCITYEVNGDEKYENLFFLIGKEFFQKI